MTSGAGSLLRGAPCHGTSLWPATDQGLDARYIPKVMMMNHGIMIPFSKLT